MRLTIKEGALQLLLIATGEGIRRDSRNHREAALALYNRNFSLPPFTGNATNYTAKIIPQTSYGVWEGWGTSLCWWGSSFGDRNDLADLFFTEGSTTTQEGLTLPGLGLSIARYNAGGSSFLPDSVGDEMIVSPNMIPSRQMFGFWQDWDSWNWTADSRQVSMLQKAQARGALHLELFSNSPMWWMCVNHNPSGNDDGSVDNLQTWNFEQHAVYLATIAAQFRGDPFYVNFTTVEAFNEPIADWWTSTGTQEGCHFEEDTQAAVVLLLRQELDARDLDSLPLAASDESFYDQALSTWESFDADTQSLIGKVNTHGYQQAGGRRDLLYAAVEGKARLWNSEYGDGDASGLSLVSNLNLDFEWLHSTAWVYWQVLDGAGWGLLESDEDAVGGPTVGAVNPKFYVLAHYSRHIRPGMTVVATTGSDTVAAYDSSSHTVAVVSVVYGQARWVTVDLSDFEGSSGGGGGLEGLPVMRWVTNTGESEAASGDLYQEYEDLTVAADGTFSVYFEPNTIMTFQVSGVVSQSSLGSRSKGK